MQTGRTLSDPNVSQVIMFDPMYDCYGSMAMRAGGLVKAVKLNVEDWSVDRDQLQQHSSQPHWENLFKARFAIHCRPMYTTQRVCTVGRGKTLLLLLKLPVYQLSCGHI